MDRRTFIRLLAAMPAALVALPTAVLSAGRDLVVRAVTPRALTNAELLEIGLTQVYKENLECSPAAWYEWLGLPANYASRRAVAESQLAGAGYTGDRAERLMENWRRSVRRST